MARALAKLRSRPSALVRAEHGGPAVTLSAAERHVFNEALRLGTDLGDELASKVTAYGRWLLEVVFDNDAGAALDDKTKNPIWLELVRRAGGPTLRISRKVLYVSLRVAAYDRRIADQSWRGLDPGRKELLLPLAEDRRLRAAAQHVSKFNLTQTKTREYVTALRAGTGEVRQVRITAPILVSRMRKLRDSLEGAGVARKLRMLQGNLEPAERAAIASEIAKLRDVLTAVARDLRGR